jgi:hypothetical protein
MSNDICNMSLITKYRFEIICSWTVEILIFWSSLKHQIHDIQLEFNREKKTATKTSNQFKIVPRIGTCDAGFNSSKFRSSCLPFVVKHQNQFPTNNSIDKTFPLCTFHNHWCMPIQAHLLWIDNFWLYTSNLCHNTKPIPRDVESHIIYIR